MMSAGARRPRARLCEGPLLGRALQTADPAVYEQYKAPKPSRFLFFDEAYGLDGTKLAEAQSAATKTPEQQTVAEASIDGDRKTLDGRLLIPAGMAVIYLLMMLYFKTIGGYKPVHIEAPARAPVGARAR